MKPTDEAIEAAFAAAEAHIGNTSQREWLREILTAAYSAQFKPVDDEALEKLVCEAILKSIAERNCTIAGVPFHKDNWTEYDVSEAIDHTRAALAIARPVIEAAERERCAKIVDQYTGCLPDVIPQIAAAIRRGE